MVKSCMICGEEETEEVRLYELPCWRHWVCKDDIADFFVRATENESLYPPRCCNEMLLLFEWAEHVPEEVQLAFQQKEQGEYAILPKFRVYCANGPCHRFLNPHVHITDEEANIVYALCEDCSTVTCVNCKGLIDEGIQDHTCKVNENDKKFQETVEQKGYQECIMCSRTIELSEACNHITCECGHNFCYVCGKDWEGVHGCPQYGPAEYDEEGYNQDGYHRDNGLNREGRTRRQQWNHERDQNNPQPEDDESDEEDPDDDVLQHVDADRREFINALDPQTRAEALDMLRIELLETQGITFNQPRPGGNNHGNDDDNEEEDEDREDEDDGGDGDEDEGDEERVNEDEPQNQADDVVDPMIEDLQPIPQVAQTADESSAAGDGERYDDDGEDRTSGASLVSDIDTGVNDTVANPPAGSGIDEETEEDDMLGDIDIAGIYAPLHQNPVWNFIAQGTGPEGNDAPGEWVNEETAPTNAAQREDDEMVGSDAGSDIIPLASGTASSDTDSQPTTPPTDHMDTTESKNAGVIVQGPSYGPQAGWEEEL